MGEIFAEAPFWNPEDTENTFDWARQQAEEFGRKELSEFLWDLIFDASRKAYKAGYHAGWRDRGDVDVLKIGSGETR